MEVWSKGFAGHPAPRLQGEQTMVGTRGQIRSIVLTNSSGVPGKEATGADSGHKATVFSYVRMKTVFSQTGGLDANASGIVDVVGSSIGLSAGCSDSDSGAMIRDTARQLVVRDVIAEVRHGAAFSYRFHRAVTRPARS